MFWAIRLPFLYILSVLYGIIQRMHPIKKQLYEIKINTPAHMLIRCRLINEGTENTGKSEAHRKSNGSRR